MSPFTSTDELNNVMKDLWSEIKANKSMANKLLESKLIVRFNYTDPQGKLTVDGSDGQELKIIVGQTALKADIEMFMQAAVANEFWSGALNVPAALISGKIKSTGPVQRALALLPIVRPARDFYPRILSNAKGKVA